MVQPGFVEDLDLEPEIADETKIDADGIAGQLAAAYQGLDGRALLEPMLRQIFPGRIAVVSSFGTEAALLLALVAEINPAVPVIFLDTGKHFEETLDYRDELVAELGLTDARSVRPDWSQLLARDPDARLWQNSPNACCHLRKVLPLRRALDGGGRRQGEDQPSGRLVTRPGRGGLRGARPAAASAAGRRLPLCRLPALHQADGAGYGFALGPLGRLGQERMRHSLGSARRVLLKHSRALPLR
jgi:hypothetical protein